LNTKKSPEPLFYIQQPELEFPKLEMQEVFMSKKTDGKCQLCNIIKKSVHDGQSNWSYLEETDAAVSKMIPLNETDSLLERNSNERIERQEKEPLDLNYDHDALQEMIAQYEMKRQFETDTRPLSSNKNHPLSLKRAKTFKEMVIDEKLEYLIRFPKPLPPVPCIFTAGNRTIRGFLMSNNERKIDIKTFDKTVLTIPIYELKDIQMIGMN